MQLRLRTCLRVQLSLFRPVGEIGDIARPWISCERSRELLNGLYCNNLFAIHISSVRSLESSTRMIPIRSGSVSSSPSTPSSCSTFAAPSSSRSSTTVPTKRHTIGEGRGMLPLGLVRCIIIDLFRNCRICVFLCPGSYSHTPIIVLLR